MRTFFFVFCFTISTLVFTQRNSGVKFGLGINTISSNREDIPEFDQHFEINSVTSFHAGYSWNLPISQKWSLQIDALYDRKGWECKLTDDQYYSTDIYNPITGEIQIYVPSDNYIYSYYNLPITVTYSINNKFFVEAGGELSGTFEITESIDYGVVIGCGYVTKYADASLRYIYGFKNVNTEDMPFEDKHRTIQFSLTIPVFKHVMRK